MASPDRAQQSFNRLRERRIAARDTLSPTLRQFYDARLSQILVGILRESYSPSLHHIPIRSIIKLLNKGATASCLYPHELYGPNLSDLADILETAFVNAQLIFKFLDHFIASPCGSWATNRRYAGNGGARLPYFLMNFAITADKWGEPYVNELQSMYNRFRAWCSLRKMMWAYESDQLAERPSYRDERSRNCQEAFEAQLLSYFS